VASPVDRWRAPALRCELTTPGGSISLCCVHLMTPRSGLEAVLHTRLDGLDDLQTVTEQRELEAEAVAACLQRTELPQLIVGDFNMPQESAIYRRHFGHYSNAQATAGLGYGYTKYTSWHGARIDHALASSQVTIQSCHVSPSLGGDHRVVITTATCPSKASISPERTAE
jgi:vancomycin resistance protein VanJ